jgi:hypothetical protein
MSTGFGDYGRKSPRQDRSIDLDAKQTGERSAGNPHAAFDVAGTENVARSRCCDTRRRKGEKLGNTNFDLHRRVNPRPYRGPLCLRLAHVWSRSQNGLHGEEYLSTASAYKKLLVVNASRCVRGDGRAHKLQTRHLIALSDHHTRVHYTAGGEVTLRFRDSSGNLRLDNDARIIVMQRDGQSLFAFC